MLGYRERTPTDLSRPATGWRGRGLRPRSLLVGLSCGVVTTGALLLVLAPTPALAGTPNSTSAAVSHGPPWHGSRTVTYCDGGGTPLDMTLFAPDTPGSADGADHADPVVLDVHGGGWQHGSRLTSLDRSTTATDLVAAGFVVASIDYRLAPANPWPDQIIDTACAVRFLRDRATDFGIDPERIAAMGTSAGGQLVSLLGTDAASPTWEQGPYGGVSSAVEAVVDEFGPADLATPDWPPATARMIHTVFGADPSSGDPVLRQASPVMHVATGDPPFLIVQGNDDQVVPATQSEELAARLRSAGVPVQLELVRGGGHGLEAPGEDPSADAISSMITSYLEHALHN
jgi:acetyl esterase/lipase